MFFKALTIITKDTVHTKRRRGRECHRGCSPHYTIDTQKRKEKNEERVKEGKIPIPLSMHPVPCRGGIFLSMEKKYTWLTQNEENTHERNI